MTAQDADFAAALHAAILARGLTLDRLAHRLGERGFTLSTATLSYWSRGRSRPERPESLAALTALEQILEVPPDSLRAQLVERVRKGRGKPERDVPFNALWGDVGEDVDHVIAQVGQPSTRRRTLAFHERFRLDATGAEQHCRVITAVEAITDNVERTLLVYRDDSGTAALPELIPVSGARLGRVRQDEATRVMVVELWLDSVLDKGERTIFEYELHYQPGGAPARMVERRFPSLLRSYLVEVEFHPEALPARCAAVSETIEGVRLSSRPVAISPDGVARAVLTDVPAGVFRIHWEWE
ncbi:hypothetical protein GCM10010174_15380 [Kutzneria viridogrisea]|uniref:HTH cro/C1-type domain-containing protein n=2 Tax=Kutzneria TaxID=43356 RepID=W5WJT6_9PSEU|nr:helix-turn-helix transcriptional regulator [Kutzneria albida]AHI00837.1 hypothetical protein KALB_7479 [Kutzneria albida DSM 43870]MBA8926114.1 transcriptional regulator with XRE-family HTH domain [Kutzneria viridogrisea]